MVIKIMYTLSKYISEKRNDYEKLIIVYKHQQLQNNYSYPIG